MFFVLAGENRRHVTFRSICKRYRTAQHGEHAFATTDVGAIVVGNVALLSARAAASLPLILQVVMNFLDRFMLNVYTISGCEVHTCGR